MRSKQYFSRTKNNPHEKSTEPSLAVNEDIAFVLKTLLGKPTDGLKREKQGNIFNPSRIY